MTTDRVLRPFKLLRSFEDYRRWSNGNTRRHCGWNRAGGIDRQGQREALLRCAPARYPCLAFADVVSMQYEESEPFYLYADTIEAMATALREVR